MNNVYSITSVPDNIATVVNGITVPDRAPYSLNGLYIACEADLFFQIRLNVDVIFSGYLTGTNTTKHIDFSSSPYGLNARDVVTVTAIQADPLTPPATYVVYSTLLVEQL